MKTIAILMTLLLSGCVAQQLQHSSEPIGLDEARALAEQVFMEQPQKFRPQEVAFTQTYIGIDNGVISQGRSRGVAIPVGNIAIVGGRNRSVSKTLNSRIYYSSIGNIRLYRKGGWFLIQIYSVDKLMLQRVYCRNEINANRFIDSLYALRNGQDEQPAS
jgi:hypothetical protein